MAKGSTLETAVVFPEVETNNAVIYIFGEQTIEYEGPADGPLRPKDHTITHKAD